MKPGAPIELNYRPPETRLHENFYSHEIVSIEIRTSICETREASKGLLMDCRAHHSTR